MSIQGGQPKKKRQGARAYEQPKRVSVNIKVPREFEALCAAEAIAPAELVRQFIADLCDLRAWTVGSAYHGNGEAAHRAAAAYHAVARLARQSKREKRAGGADVATPQPPAETRAMSPIEALAQAVASERKDQP